MLLIKTYLCSKTQFVGSGLFLFSTIDNEWGIWMGVGGYGIFFKMGRGYYILYQPCTTERSQLKIARAKVCDFVAVQSKGQQFCRSVQTKTNSNSETAHQKRNLEEPDKHKQRRRIQKHCNILAMTLFTNSQC